MPDGDAGAAAPTTGHQQGANTLAGRSIAGLPFEAFSPDQDQA